METNERVQVIIELFQEGHSPEEIADLLGYKGKGGVSGYMRRHGYRWDWTVKNYVPDPVKNGESSKSVNQQALLLDQATSNLQKSEMDSQTLPVSNEWQGSNQQQLETGNPLKEASNFLQESQESKDNNVVSFPKSVEKKPATPAVLPPELLHGLQEILRNKDKLLNMVTDGAPPLHMKRYRGPAVTKTVQFQAQLSERLSGFVNNTGFTVKDVVNKAVEEFLERYGG
ncbi:helix-turn-helix domain-containing protein [Brevibacillus humidisoli]|uniref:helix-turn-helix domain-containing protein n=1 Tax=Brevibacillus humidisoli TaxID=2895522 RepID=UPI001E5C7122|nr:helix-turn-helix domain-containing protein [Brevibacillus humidisoli]UFJ40127.1 helix-turn-helix domain-containing protein [Brevibacillus humidisoli]